MNSGDEARDLLQIARDLVRSLERAENRVHDGEFLTAGMRDLVLELDRLGPRTVPRIARDHNFSRQYVQTVVNRLADRGVVAKIPNPSHRRSPRIRLTPEGQAVARWLDRRRRTFLDRVRNVSPGADLRVAAETLRLVRDLLE